jgi:glycosyltransferase involved in cell wall biosynthesis
MTSSPIQRVLVVSFSVVPDSSRQGIEIETVIKSLAPRFTVDVLSIRTAAMGFVERYRRTRMLRVPVGDGKRLEQVEAFRRAVRRQLEGAEYDLIHFRSAYGGVPICNLKEYLDCKLVYEVALSSSTERGRVSQAVLEELESDEEYCLSQADLLIVRCQSAADALKAKGVLTPMAVVPPGVDIDTFDWEPNAPQSTHRIVHVGRLGPGRGIRNLLEAFRELLEYSEANLTLVGPVEEIFAEYLDDAITRLGIKPHVTLLGEVDHEEIPRIISMADLCVSPWSPSADHPLYGYPTKLFEYMACRRAVIAMDEPVIRELLGPRPPVKLVTPEDASDLASAMLQLLADEKANSRLAEDGYNLVRSQFSAAAARRALLTAYGMLFPAGTNLWGHEDVLKRRPTGTFTSPTSQTGSDRFHDTRPHSDGAFNFPVTPTSGIQALGSRPETRETWILLSPDTNTDPGIPRSSQDKAQDSTTDPEFVAAGQLLGSEEGESHSDTDPLGKNSDSTPDSGPQASPET